MQPSKHWKNIEAKVAKFFGTRRTPLSGGNSGHTRSDTLHPRLFIEAKHRKNSAAVNLYEQTVVLAKKEEKVPFLVLHKKKSRVYVVVCAMKDLIAISREIVDRGITDETQLESVSKTGPTKRSRGRPI